jgi:two-component sensor histidine kinase
MAQEGKTLRSLQSHNQHLKKGQHAALFCYLSQAIAMKRKRFLLLLILTCLAGVGYSQRADTLLRRAKVCYNRCPDSAFKLANQACLLARKSGNRVILIKSLNLITLIYWTKRDYITAKTYGKQSLHLVLDYHIDSLAGDSWMILGLLDHTACDYQAAIEKYSKAIWFYHQKNKIINLAKCYTNIGICQKELSRFNEAIRYCLAAANYFEIAGDDRNLSNTYKTIALCFVALNNYPTAIAYNKKALHIREHLNDRQLIAQSFNNIGFAFKESNQPDSAIFYLSKSIGLYENVRDSSLLVLPLQNLGSCLKMKGNLDKARGYIMRSLHIASNYDMKEEVAQGSLDLAEVYTSENKFNLAITAVNKTENTAIQLKLAELLMDAYTAKSNLYMHAGSFEKALIYDKKRNVIKDSLFTVAKNKTIEELEIKYQTREKEKDISALHFQNDLGSKIVKQQKRFILILIVAGFLLLLLLVIAYNNFRVKNKANKRIRTLMQELHHRVKNNLQILSGLFTMQIEELSDEKTKSALRENELRLASMNLVHNKLYLDNSNNQIEMGDYLTKLLQHVKASFAASNIHVHIDIEALMLDADKAVAIGLIVNELATNAFKYAFGEDEGQIYLSLKRVSSSKILLQLGDNGKGVDLIYREKVRSFGLKLVNLMARQLNSTVNIKSDKGIHYEFEMAL